MRRRKQSRKADATRAQQTDEQQWRAAFESCRRRMGNSNDLVGRKGTKEIPIQNQSICSILNRLSCAIFPSRWWHLSCTTNSSMPLKSVTFNNGKRFQLFEYLLIGTCIMQSSMLGIFYWFSVCWMESLRGSFLSLWMKINQKCVCSFGPRTQNIERWHIQPLFKVLDQYMLSSSKPLLATITSRRSPQI